MGYTDCTDYGGPVVTAEETEAMWGGPGHTVVHASPEDHPGYCVQVNAPGIADANFNTSALRAKAEKWGRKHHAIINNGPCGKKFSDFVGGFNKGDIHVKTFMI